jgi:hypothetical protein
MMVVDGGHKNLWTTTDDGAERGANMHAWIEEVGDPCMRALTLPPEVGVRACRLLAAFKLVTAGRYGIT